MQRFSLARQETAMKMMLADCRVEGNPGSIEQIALQTEYRLTGKNS
jgi:hypothetical protein